MNRFDAIVIGAGHNGLTCAGYLAMAGLKVLVLEQRDIVGGCVSTEELFPGYRFNTGALELVGLHGGRVVKDLDLEKFGLTFIEMDPQIFAPFPGGMAQCFPPAGSETRGRWKRHALRSHGQVRETLWWNHKDELYCEASRNPGQHCSWGGIVERRADRGQDRCQFRRPKTDLLTN